MSKSQPSVAIAILNWNGLKFLQQLLPELKLLTYSNYKVYVIDNHSSDESVNYCKQNHPEVQTLVLEDNYGFAGGYNRGLALIEEDYYLIMNSDVEVPISFIEPLVEMMEADKNIAICQPKLLAQLDKTMFEHAGAAGGMMDLLGYPFCRGRIFEYTEADNGQYNNPMEIFWATGACSMVRKESYWKVNGMYEYFFMHSEEIDMCWQLIAHGQKIVYCPASFIYHLGGGSLSYHTPKKTYYNFRNNLVMIVRNSPWHQLLWLVPIRFALDMLAVIVFLIKENTSNSRAVLGAYKDFFKWLIKDKTKSPELKISLMSIPIVYKKSIVWQHYVKKVQFYTNL